MSYEKFYPNGWQSGESGGTPITPDALNHIEQGIQNAYGELAPAVESSAYPGCYYRTVDGVTEWVNPPMVPSVEYRTTERYNGKVVYAKLIDFGALPNTTTKTLYIAVSAENMVDVELSAHNQNGEWINSLSHYSGGYVFVYLNTLGVTTRDDKSHWTAFITIRYIKD